MNIIFINSFFNPFVDIALTFIDSSFNFFLTGTCFVLAEVIFLFKLFSFLSKSVFNDKTTILFLLVKFCCSNLLSNVSDVNLLNSGLVIYLSGS